VDGSFFHRPKPQGDFHDKAARGATICAGMDFLWTWGGNRLGSGKACCSFTNSIAEGQESFYLLKEVEKDLPEGNPTSSEKGLGNVVRLRGGHDGPTTRARLRVLPKDAPVIECSTA